jgi:competence protein ComEA
VRTPFRPAAGVYAGLAPRYNFGLPSIKHVHSVSLGVAACALLATTLLAASAPVGQSPAQPPSVKPADDPAAGLFVRLCVDCHDAAPIVSTRRTRTDWEDVVDKMIEKGATGTEKEFETVFEYLLRHYGKVYINTAKADEIATILGLSQQDAEAIVAFRTKNGPFADFAAVTKVPNIDVKKLEEHKNAVAF